uniref:C-type lectin domain-containing protein n=1 Tax=Caenorhabditis japonica TaxID=281687 RepID=A0A8R1DVJ6_CAEJA
MFAILTLLVFFGVPTCHTEISVIRYNVSFPYLISRTVLLTANVTKEFDMNKMFVDNCNTQMCFVAFYRNETKCQILLDIQNNCTQYPNCLGYSEDEYNFSLVFLNTSSGCANSEANKELIDAETRLSTVCPSGWFSYVRQNGRTWCYVLNNSNYSWVESNKYCTDYNATLNGFETPQERDSFISKDFQWIAGVSLNNTLANDNFNTTLKKSGDYLAMSTTTGAYVGVSNDTKATLSCGNYADLFA